MLKCCNDPLSGLFVNLTSSLKHRLHGMVVFSVQEIQKRDKKNKTEIIHPIITGNISVKLLSQLFTGYYRNESVNQNRFIYLDNLLLLTRNDNTNK
ncbi:hypothetical protein Bhyg_13172 [Pseudolycoriella hygida]|uniref:Uncharacterized protein n=1 Tax=Pseudolycoriella hygida TaxID=35572 RepID=A0A9Q0MQT3_9DIPT|nr:hypothetical protein Bhyg_13172 [Pseudolycoriella hygida]